MPCSNPSPGYFKQCPFTGENKLVFSGSLRKIFRGGGSLTQGDVLIPCGQCLYCRVKNSREWAIRCMHEAEMHPVNAFVTLTFDDVNLRKFCPDGSLNKAHMVDFMKRLRRADEYAREKSGLPFRSIRALYCGEYGGITQRPHYHALLFNCDFPDQVFYKRRGVNRYYNSDFLQRVWPYGFAVIGNVEYSSAAYCARYVTKKITGVKAFDHYQGREPEFAQASRKPGLGYDWLIKNFSDVYPSDEVVVVNSKSSFKLRPPRYYDKILKEIDPEMYLRVKQKRLESSVQDELPDFSDLVREGNAFKKNMQHLVRSLEVSYDS